MTWWIERGTVSSYTHMRVCAASAHFSNRRTWPSPLGSAAVVRFSASPAWRSSRAIGWATDLSVSVVWRETPQTLLTKAEQSRPLSLVPPHTYGTSIKRWALARMSLREIGVGPPGTMAGAETGVGADGRSVVLK